MNRDLQKIVASFILGIDDADSLLDKEAIMNRMKQIIEAEGGYKITAPKAGAKVQRWTSYIKDDTQPNGRRKISKATEKELLAFLWEHYNLGKSEESRQTLGEFWETFVEYKKERVNVENRKYEISESTIRRYIRDYKNHISCSALDKTPLCEITPLLLEQELKKIVREHTLFESFTKNLLGYIKNCIEYAEEQNLVEGVSTGFLGKYPMILAVSIPNPPKIDTKRVLNKFEYQALLGAVLEQQKKNPHYIPNYAIELAMLTGFRVGELAGLKWCNIDDDFIYIKIAEKRIDHENGTSTYIIDEPKNGKHRAFPITDDIRKVLDKIKALGHISPDGFVFCRKDGTRQTAHDISCAVYRRSKEAEIDKSSIHGIRRTVSSELRKILPRAVVASLMGHLDDTNDRFYDYDNVVRMAKVDAISSFYSNLLKDEEKDDNKKITETLVS